MLAILYFKWQLWGTITHLGIYNTDSIVILLLKEKVSICLNSTDAYSKHNVWVLRPIGQDDLRSLYSTLFKMSFWHEGQEGQEVDVVKVSLFFYLML